MPQRRIVLQESRVRAAINIAELTRRAKVKGLQIPSYPALDAQSKVSAAWLVEHSGFSKGYNSGRVGISRKHALAIVNRGDATAADILGLKDTFSSGWKNSGASSWNRNLSLWASRAFYILGYLSEGMFETEIKQDRSFPCARPKSDRHADSRHDLQSILEVVSPADPGTKKERTGPPRPIACNHYL